MIPSITLIVFIFLIFHSEKYPRRVIAYILIPCFIFNLLKKRKYFKTGFEIPILLISGSIFLSSLGAYMGHRVIDNAWNFFTIASLPIIISQFPEVKKYRLKMLYVGCLSSIIFVSRNYLEKLGYIDQRFNNRISGGEDIWIVATVLMMIIIISIIIFQKYYYRFPENLMIIMYGFVFLIPLVWSQNRANWVGLIIFLVVYLLKEFKFKGFCKLLVIFLILLGVVKSMPNNSYVKRLKSIENVETDRSNYTRIALWKESIRVLKKSPIKGVGFDKSSYQNAVEPELRGIDNLQKYDHPHNDFLYVLASCGIIGGIAYILYIGKILLTSYKDKTFFGRATFYLFVGVLSFGLFEAPIKYGEIQGILSLFLGLMLINEEKYETEEIN